jgi:dihydroorotase
VHHLHFSSDDYPHYGNLIKCNPAIKSPADRDALRAALKTGRLDIIATDHAPHTREEKAARDYLQAPAGLPLVQDALLSVLELFHDGILSLTEIVTRMAHNPAKRFQLRERGFLREGYHADLVMVDTREETEVRENTILSRCGWSPFLGKKFRSRIDYTWINGALAWQQGQIVEHQAARRLEFDRPKGSR